MESKIYSFDGSLEFEERRVVERFSPRKPINVMFDVGRPAIMRDVSAHGCYLKSNFYAAPGTTISLSVDPGYGQIISVRGKITRVENNDGFAVEFVDERNNVFFHHFKEFFGKETPI